MLAPNIHCLRAKARANFVRWHHCSDFAVAVSAAPSLSSSSLLLRMARQSWTVLSGGSNLLLGSQRRAHGRAQPFLIELVRQFTQLINLNKKCVDTLEIKTLSSLKSILISCFSLRSSSIRCWFCRYHIRDCFSKFLISLVENTKFHFLTLVIKCF